MKLSLCLWLVVLVALPIFAQDSTPEATETTLAQNARDYCAGQVSYTLPDGWAGGVIQRGPASVSQQIASSKDTLNKYATLLDPDEASVIIGVFDRKSFAQLMKVDASVGIDDLLKAVLEQPGSETFTLSPVARQTIGRYPAAYVSGVSANEYQFVVFIAFDDETLGLVLLSSSPQANPQATTQWNDSALALAESLDFDIPRWPEVEGSLPLTQTFAPSDCSVVAGYPEGWTATPLSAEGAPVLKAWMTNYETAGEQSGNLLDSGQARIEMQITSADRVTGDLAASANQAIQSISQQAGTKVVRQFDGMIGTQKARSVELSLSKDAKHIGDALTIAVANRDRSVTTLTLYAAPGELDRWRATALAVALSLQVQLPPSS